MKKSPVLMVSLASVLICLGTSQGIVSAASRSKILTTLDIPYAGTDNPRQCLDLFLPGERHSKSPLPVIVFIHGGAWRAGNKRGGQGRVRPFVESGSYAGVSVAYRLTGEAQWPAQIHDCKAAIRWIRANAQEHGLDPDRIGVWGTSAGGHLVAMLGTSAGVPAMDGDLGPHNRVSTAVTCVVDFFGPTDFLQMDAQRVPGSIMAHDPADSPESQLIGGAIQLHPDRVATANPITYVTADDPAFLIMHGDDDRLVPIHQSEIFDKALREAVVDVTFVPIAGAGHGLRGVDTSEQVTAFFDRHLRQTETRSTHNAYAADPPRMKRANAFLGIHFDFHVGDDCKSVGKRTTPEMVELVIDKVKPDYIQIDCKGHRGYSSYPTKVGNPAPGFIGDPLRIWRDVTRKRGVSLFMHYSGVWDFKAVADHPDWAAINGDGKPSDRAASVFGPYADTLMIPQLRELAGQYGVDGVWVDGDCWGTTPDYSEVTVKTFCKQTGAESAPHKRGDPYWNEWMDFHREGFRSYVRHYVDELRASHPGFQVISNWAFSDHMPEAVSANVAGLSGDFSPDDSLNSARFAGRCLEDQGMPWDLMSWSFSRKTGKQKPAVQLMQEAAQVLALGGGYQAYFKQDRDGAIRNPAEMDVMAEVARFCRARQAYCHKSVAVPQIAMLYSTAGHYRESPSLFHWNGSHGVKVLRKALTEILQNQYGVQILSEHQLSGHTAQWPVIVVPGWAHLEPEFRGELVLYAKSGGRLVLIGSGPRKLFETELGSTSNLSIVQVNEVDQAFSSVLKQVLPNPVVKVVGAKDLDVSPRMLNGNLTIHLVNTSGPHANAPDGGITEVKPLGPLTVSISLAKAPKAILMQPQGTSLDVTWSNGRAQVTLPQLDLYSILVVKP